MKIASLILPAACLALACPLPAAAHSDAPVATGPALWQLADEDTTIYLFGTVHFLPDDVEWYDARVSGALASADEYVTEIDTSQIPQGGPGAAPSPQTIALAQRIMAMARLTQGENVRELMTPEDAMQYEAALSALGVAASSFDPFEPWFAFINVQQLALARAGITSASGVERTLDRYVEGLQRTELESIEEQLGFFDSLPLDLQLTLLDETVEGLPTLRDSFNRMADDWLAGDAEALAQLMNEGMADPALYDRLLIARNANWAGWIERRLAQPGTVFVAVGAGHLAGDGSVQTMLEQRGYTVTRIWQ